jgi:hypothetical protein
MDAQFSDRPRPLSIKYHRGSVCVQSGEGVKNILSAIGGGRVADPPLRMLDSQLPDRRSIRWRGYDYSPAGIYFVTICTFERRLIFGSISLGGLVPSFAGRTVLEYWLDLPNHHAGLELDAFVVMPNHFHGILILNSPTANVRAKSGNGDGVVGGFCDPAAAIPVCPELCEHLKRIRR